jgi:hypothetical protein
MRSKFESRGGNKFRFFMSSIQGVGVTQPPIQRMSGALSPGVKGPGRGADHSDKGQGQEDLGVYIHSP